MNNRARDRRGALQMHAVVAEADTFALKHIQEPTQRPILRRWYGVGRTFPCAQAIAMDPSARGELILVEMREDAPSTNHRACDSR
jgi:hypothetical protein